MDTKKWQRGYKILDGPNTDKLIDAFKYAYGYSISDGPNADRLIDAFKYACGHSVLSVTFEVEFDTGNSEKYDCRICSIEHLNDSGHLFKIKGHLRDLPNTSFVGHYEAASRKGAIKFY